MTEEQKELLKKLKEDKEKITNILKKNGKEYQQLSKNERPRIK